MYQIERTAYLNTLHKYLEAPAITVVTGLRRVGKSVLLRQLSEQLREKGFQVVYIDKESLDFDHLKTAHDLVRFIKEDSKDNSLGSELTYIIIDEVQQIDQWERAVASLNAETDTRIVISGSNASLLSGDLATRIAGRYLTLRVYPLSLIEFAELHTLIHGRKLDNEALLQNYLKIGGLPGLLHTDLSPEVLRQMQSDVVHSIAIRDIISRYHIRDIRLFEDVMAFAMDNIGNLLSAKKITDFLKKERRSVSVDSVLNYLHYMQESYLISEAPRFDIKGKKRLEVNPKYYIGDIGLRNGFIAYRDKDISGLLENLVYLELCRRGYSVQVGSLTTQEIDFIAETRQQRVYIQVAYLLENSATISREIAPLETVNDSYPKILLSMDKYQPRDFNGIRHASLFTFLKGTPIETL